VNAPAIAALDDQRAGQRLAFLGAARILREAEYAPSNRERIARWQRAMAMQRSIVRIAAARARRLTEGV